jgi:hypothetical protein
MKYFYTAFIEKLILVIFILLISHRVSAQDCWATGYDPAKWNFTWNCSGLAGTCGQNITNSVTGAGNFYYDLSPKTVSGGVSHGQVNAMWYSSTVNFAGSFTLAWEFRFRKDANNPGASYPPTAQDNYNDGFQLMFVGVGSGNAAPSATEACWAGQSGGAIGGFWYNGSNTVAGTQACGSGAVTVGHVLGIQFDMVDNKLSGNTDPTEPGIQEHLGIGHSNGGQPLHTYNFCAPVTVKPGAFTYPGSSVRDGSWHSVSVTWTPTGGNTGSFTVVVDGNTRMSGCSVPASVGSDIRQAFNFWSPGTKTAMWGFTGATGPDATIANADDIHIRFPCVAAPVNLLNFDATLNNNGTVTLGWRTASEQNNNYFVLEKSYDGIHFESIGTVKGNGNSAQLSEYSFIDSAPGIGIAYYRLKQVDFNGQSEYFKWIRMIDNGGANKTEEKIEVYPNPGNGLYTVLASGIKEDALIEVINTLGETVYKKQIASGISDNFSLEMDITAQAKGIYFVRITDGNGVYSQIVMKE